MFNLADLIFNTSSLLTLIIIAFPLLKKILGGLSPGRCYVEEFTAGRAHAAGPVGGGTPEFLL